MQESLKLSEFLELIKSTIEMSFGYEGFWIVAELSEWRKSGKHYYGELVEHDGFSKYPIAKIRCNCWANKAEQILSKFSLATGDNLNSEMKLLLKVSVNYHTSFGLSLNIIDVDPTFTLGDRQARKQEIIETLKKKNILDKNKKLELPIDFTRIAVITSLTAAGKGDFFEEADKLQSLDLCQFDIYEAKMQGKDCPVSIANALEKISKKADRYDAVVIIRGGGSQTDLDSFNDLLAAESICNSSLPVMVGIGHERDNTVLDDICTKRFDTPSKVINFIINAIIDNSENAKYNYESVVNITTNLAKNCSRDLLTLYSEMKSTIDYYLSSFNQRLEYANKNTISISKSLIRLYRQSANIAYKDIFISSESIIDKYNHRANDNYKHILEIAQNTTKYYTLMSEQLYKQILSVSIQPTLNRGFSITRSLSGKYITSKKEAQALSNLEIMYADGQVQVEVKSASNNS